MLLNHNYFPNKGDFNCFLIAKSDRESREAELQVAPAFRARMARPLKALKVGMLNLKFLGHEIFFRSCLTGPDPARCDT